MTTPVLWHFRFSHYNEKARWALDWKGLPHVRRSLVPGLHVPRVLWLTGQKAVPVLVVDGKSRGISPPLRVVELPPGAHTIEIRNSTFPAHKQKVQLKAGQAVRIQHRFK